ncbi:hypothetical protein SCAR479_04757 [Seiridium cardinale]|uniref:Uncharacterized protein n=1 Tax=Seiridium cardinale TaxID=138064 RepID=A0ABR2XXF1_9PEZI
MWLSLSSSPALEQSPGRPRAMHKGQQLAGNVEPGHGRVTDWEAGIQTDTAEHGQQTTRCEILVSRYGHNWSRHVTATEAVQSLTHPPRRGILTSGGIHHVKIRTSRQTDRSREIEGCRKLATLPHIKQTRWQKRFAAPAANIDIA